VTTNELKLEQYNGTRQVGLTRFGVGDYALGYIAPAGVWTHLAFVGTAAGTSLYVNGSLQSTTNVSIPLPRAYVGARYYAVSSSPFFVDYMLGGLDEVLLFNRALSGSEIHAVYAAGSSGLVRVPEFIGAGPFASGQFPLNLRGQTARALRFTVPRTSPPGPASEPCPIRLASPNSPIPLPPTPRDFIAHPTPEGYSSQPRRAL